MINGIQDLRENLESIARTEEQRDGAQFFKRFTARMIEIVGDIEDSPAWQYKALRDYGGKSLIIFVTGSIYWYYYGEYINLYEDFKTAVEDISKGTFVMRQAVEGLLDKIKAIEELRGFEAMSDEVMAKFAKMTNATASVYDMNQLIVPVVSDLAQRFKSEPLSDLGEETRNILKKYIDALLNPDLDVDKKLNIFNDALLYYYGKKNLVLMDELEKTREALKEIKHGLLGIHLTTILQDENTRHLQNAGDKMWDVTTFGSFFKTILRGQVGVFNTAFLSKFFLETIQETADVAGATLKEVLEISQDPTAFSPSYIVAKLASFLYLRFSSSSFDLLLINLLPTVFKKSGHALKWVADLTDKTAKAIEGIPLLSTPLRNFSFALSLIGKLVNYAGQEIGWFTNIFFYSIPMWSAFVAGLFTAIFTSTSIATSIVTTFWNLTGRWFGALTYQSILDNPKLSHMVFWTTGLFFQKVLGTSIADKLLDTMLTTKQKNWTIVKAKMTYTTLTWGTLIILYRTTIWWIINKIPFIDVIKFIFNSGINMLVSIGKSVIIGQENDNDNDIDERVKKLKRKFKKNLKIQKLALTM